MGQFILTMSGIFNLFGHFSQQILTISNFGQILVKFCVKFWSNLGQILCQILVNFCVKFWSTFVSNFGQLLANFWSIFGQLLAKFWSNFGHFLVIFWSIHFVAFASKC